MAGDKVIIDRSRLESLERKVKLFEKDLREQFIKVTHGYYDTIYIPIDKKEVADRIKTLEKEAGDKTRALRKKSQTIDLYKSQIDYFNGLGFFKKLKYKFKKYE